MASSDNDLLHQKVISKRGGRGLTWAGYVAVGYRQTQFLIPERISGAEIKELRQFF